MVYVVGHVLAAGTGFDVFVASDLAHLPSFCDRRVYPGGCFQNHFGNLSLPLSGNGHALRVSLSTEFHIFLRNSWSAR